MPKPITPVIPGLEKYEIKVAEHQDQYETIPSLPLEPGGLLSRWEFTEQEIIDIVRNRCLYFTIYTGGQPMQPVKIETELVLVEKEKEI